MSYEPELGQLAWSNSEWYEHEMESHVEAGIALLGLLIADGDWERDCTGNHGPAGNIESGAFEIRGYCWCDGEAAGHENGCPPNFKFGDFECRWYKHLGRGSTQSRIMPFSEWRKIMSECLASLS